MANTIRISKIDDSAELERELSRLGYRRTVNGSQAIYVLRSREDIQQWLAVQ